MILRFTHEVGSERASTLIWCAGKTGAKDAICSFVFQASILVRSYD
jgi:hypothetical protein